MSLYKFKTQEQKQIEFSDTTHKVDVTYYMDDYGEFLIRQTDSDISFVLEPEKIAEISKKIGFSASLNPSAIETLALTGQQYDELLIRYKTLLDATADSDEKRKVYEKARDRLEKANMGSYESLNAIFNPQEPASEQEITVAAKDDTKFMMPDN